MTDHAIELDKARRHIIRILDVTPKLAESHIQNQINRFSYGEIRDVIPDNIKNNLEEWAINWIENGIETYHVHSVCGGEDKIMEYEKRGLDYFKETARTAVEDIYEWIRKNNESAE